MLFNRKYQTLCCELGIPQSNMDVFSPASKVMLKILQTRLQQYVNWELSDVQAGFRKGRRTRGQIVNIFLIMEKAREFQKNIYFWSIEYAKAFDYVGWNKLGKFLKEGSTRPPYLSPDTYAGKEATVRTGHGTTDWFKIGKGVSQGCIWSPCLFNLCADCVCVCVWSLCHSVMSNSLWPHEL